jgi:thiamine-monophosphate kinase
MVEHPNEAALDPDAIGDWIRQRFDAPLLASAGVSDCAIFDAPAPVVLATTDFINASPIIFELEIGGMYDLGTLVVAASVADLLGSGAKPHSILLSAVLPRGTLTSTFYDLMNGVGDMATTCGALLVGGDTKLGASLAVCATALGFVADPNAATPRHRGQPDDDVWVSGWIGSAACAVHSYRSAALPQSWRAWAAQVLRVPMLPLEKCGRLRGLSVVNAGCDISDGLGADLSGLAMASGLGLEIDAALIPLHPNVVLAAAAAQVPPWLYAFASGGDFQVAMTANRKHRSLLSDAGFTRIGRLTAERTTILRLAPGREVAFPKTGHRDARGLPFAAEVEHLLTNLMREF